MIVQRRIAQRMIAGKASIVITITATLIIVRPALCKTCVIEVSIAVLTIMLTIAIVALGSPVIGSEMTVRHGSHV